MRMQDSKASKDFPKKNSENLKGVNILFEDAHILVCYKPSGIATQSKNIRTPDMVSILKNYLSNSSQVKSSSANAHMPGTLRTSGNLRTSGSLHTTDPYLAVVHRLDQPVEGLLVFAKTPFAAKELNRELTSHGFGKYYRALVSHAPADPEACLENYLVKDARTNTSRICSKDTKGAKLARLSYKTVEENARYFSTAFSTADSADSTADSADSTADSADSAADSAGITDGTFASGSGANTTSGPGTKIAACGKSCELDIHLDTGRHHQIRVQLAGIGCPIVGDTKYNPEAQKKRMGRLTHTRLCLCSYRLEFTHPKTKKQMIFSLF